MNSMMACYKLEFGRTRLDFSSCGCSSNASFDRFLVRNSSKGVLRNLSRVCKAKRIELSRCRVFSTKTPEAFLNGNGVAN